MSEAEGDLNYSKLEIGKISSGKLRDRSTGYLKLPEAQKIRGSLCYWKTVTIFHSKLRKFGSRNPQRQ